MWRRKSLVLVGHLILWILLYVLVHDWLLPVLISEVFPISMLWQRALFFHYGLLLNICLVYLYVYYFQALFIRKNRPGIYLRWNLIFWIGFSLVETGIDYLYLGSSFDAVLWKINATTTLLILLLVNFICLVKAWFEEQKKRGVMEREKLRAELSALKQQINPHFLFNSLNSLYGMAFENEDEETAEGIAKLSTMMRYLLYETNAEEVSLTKELEYLKNYIDLQKMRVSSQVDVQFEVKGNPSGHMIPPMLFQPFIENAFKYGISQLRPSQIKIDFLIEPNKLVFRTQNTRHPVIQSQTQHKGIGIKNVKKRLGLLLKSRHRLEVINGDNFFSILLEIDMIDPMRRHLPHLFTNPLKK